MAHHPKRLVASAIILFSVAFCAPLAHTQAGLKPINSPQGGKIAYGQVVGQTTEAAAMGAVLRSLHSQLGDRPQVGKLFQVRGTESVAAFFSVNKRTQGGGQIAGMIIATKASNTAVEAALVYDDAARFPKTLTPMMKTLMAVWHPLNAASSAGLGATAPARAAAPDHAPRPFRQHWSPCGLENRS
jgi:hypothetical protein